MLFALSLQTAAAFAGEPEEDSEQLATAAVPPIAVSPISGYFNLTFASDYLPRGITVINQGYGGLPNMVPLDNSTINNAIVLNAQEAVDFIANILESAETSLNSVS